MRAGGASGMMVVLAMLAGPVWSADGGLCAGLCTADLRQCRDDVQSAARFGRPFADAVLAANRSAVEPWRSPGLAMQMQASGPQDPGQAVVEERLHDCDVVQQACLARCMPDPADDPAGPSP